MPTNNDGFFVDESGFYEEMLSTESIRLHNGSTIVSTSVVPSDRIYGFSPVEGLTSMPDRERSIVETPYPSSYERAGFQEPIGQSVSGVVLKLSEQLALLETKVTELNETIEYLREIINDKFKE